MFSEVHKRSQKIGQPPGTPIYTGKKTDITPTLTVCHYDAQTCVEKSSTQLTDCLEDNTTGITWVDVKGLHDVPLVESIAKQFKLHPLTVEDILNVEQRPKVEEFDGYIFVTLKSLHWHAKTSNFTVHQLSFVLGERFVLSFHDTNTLLFDSIRTRLQTVQNQRLRQQGSDYLLYRLIDAIVDEYFVALEALGDLIEKTEDKIVTSPKPQNARTIYRLKRQMLQLRKAIWPMREAVNHLLHVEDELISKFTRVYMRDVYDHTVQAIDSVETFREMLSSMLDMYLSSLTNRMNEIMKILTIISTIFIPITAIASIYGMNFGDMPGTQWRYGYDTVIIVMAVIAVLMLIYFRRKHWL